MSLSYQRNILAASHNKKKQEAITNVINLQLKKKVTYSKSNMKDR